ncbi:HD domain-containing protein [Longispora albida]|uniref:HD domain-containing protein n=1 Tax=Longispora albida TaxID=203523 RepID=UPI00036AF7A3|nr:hypothetical protein [Longispora albida]
MTDGLLAQWRETVVRCGADDPGSAAGAELLARWGEPHRKYHTVEHLRAVLSHVDTLAAHAQNADAVRLGAWFHDAVYVPGQPGNEEDSARLAETVLPRLGAGIRLTDEVARLVRLTAAHDPAPGDANGGVLCDADLAVLGGGPGAYLAYVAAVREEYAFVPDELFRPGRAAILQQLLGLPALFHTPLGRERWAEAARRNIEAELASYAS